MKLANFLIGTVGVVIAFAIVTYVMTGSLWTAFTQSLICFLLMQVGYFSVVVFLIVRNRWSAARNRKAPPVPENSLRDPH